MIKRFIVIFGTLSVDQKLLFDKLLQNNDELFDVKLQRENEIEKTEKENQKFREELDQMTAAFANLQVSNKKKIQELDDKIKVLKDQSRYKYVLDFKHDGFDDEMSEQSDSSASDSDEDYNLPPESKRVRLENKYSTETWENIIEKLDKGWSFSTIQAQHKKLSDRKEISRMREYLTSNGSKIQKYSDIHLAVLKDFLNMRSELEEIHDRDLIDSALKAADELGLTTFKASEGWLHGFKKKNRIVSRKINAVVTKAQLGNQPELNDIIEEFRGNMKAVIAENRLEKIFNADQTGIKQEMISGRTLAVKGEKKIKAVVKRVNATTHSYTVQVLISAAGKLVVPVMVVFCEPKRPACFDQQLLPFKNIKAYSTTSGIMTSQLGITWLKDIYKPNAGENSILMVDSWTGYQQAIDQDNGSVQIHILPPKSTSVAQLLDVYFNRPFKNFLRLISCKIRRLFPKFDLSNRQGMATLIDIAIGQFSAPAFNAMIKYAWFASGYLEERPAEFETPVAICFDSIKIDSKCGCGKRAFIKCAHCDNFYCFDHFVKDLHRCYV
uniref:HTH CENPB-type domain-containing protein n=1 Tax=Panagrolaimus superbus TaxID=310955 RepID=A0A914XS31_9BILA